MRMTIYLPDDLAEMVREQADLNVSAVCQEALRRELVRREELAKLDKEMHRIVLYDDGRGADVAFVGKELYHSYGLPEETAYLTKRHRIAVYSHSSQVLHEFDSFGDLEADEVWRDSSPELLAGVAEALGESHVIELDI
jgi:post-segregation antitoxin (ccd killing protein)